MLELQTNHNLELQTLMQACNQVLQDTSLKTSCNFSFYIKKVQMRRFAFDRNNEEIQEVVQQALTEFNSKAHNSSNLQNNNILFTPDIKVLDINNNLYNKANTADKSRYNLELDLSQSNTLKKLFKTVEITVNYNDEVKQLYGSFIWTNYTANKSYFGYIDSQYIYYFINNFIETYLSPFSYFHLLTKFNKDKQNYYNYIKNIFITNFTTSIGAHNLEASLHDLDVNDLFKELVTLYLYQCSLVQSLSNYFKTKDYNKNVKTKTLNNFKELHELSSLVTYLMYFDFTKEFQKRNHSQKYEEKYFFNLGFKDVYLAAPVNNLHFNTQEVKEILKPYFVKNNPLQFFFLMYLINPGLFGLYDDSCIFASLDHVKQSFLAFVKNSQTSDNEFTTKKFNELIFETNFNYLALINKLNVLIINESTQQNVEALSSFKWVQGFVASINLQKNVLQRQTAYLKQRYIKKKFFFYREAVDDVHVISLTNMQEVYSSEWTRKTVARFYDNLDLNHQLLDLTDDIKFSDEFYKREFQRDVIIFGIFVATLIAFVDFGNTTWTVLSCSQTDLGMNLPGGAQSAINPDAANSCIGLLVMLMAFNGVILIMACSYLVYAWRKFKKMGKKERVTL
ncbi:hypothetical protein [Ureaplasma ceti]|uniref:Transmembrane protein n=1 Tax=Ureaplasma ceti TaxID=3119530 RepID=A0ABP9U4T2_9BACT